MSTQYCEIHHVALRCPVCTGALGGKQKSPTKGFGNPAILAKALATRKSKIVPIGTILNVSETVSGCLRDTKETLFKS